MCQISKHFALGLFTLNYTLTIITKTCFTTATQTINPYDEEEILKDSIIRYPNLNNSDMTKINRTKNLNSIAVQTERLTLEYSNSVSRKDFKSLKHDDIHSKGNKSNSVKFKENHQPGEIPKYVKLQIVLK